MKPHDFIAKAAILIGATSLVLAPASQADEKPVKVFILSGQSNMVGFGAVYGGNARWGKEFIDPVVSVYQEAYDPVADYDALEPTETKKLEEFGGVSPTPFPEGGGTYVVRGQIQVAETGRYRFRSGWDDSTYNAMEVDGKEVYRKEIGGEPKYTEIKVGDLLEEPVLLLKTSQGNRALGWDFLPPGSERYEFKGKKYAGYKNPQMSWDIGTEPEPSNWYAGKQYDICFEAAHDVLNNFDKNFPHWAGRGYEIVGFGWWQGDRDRYTEAHAANYEKNLVQLINTLRSEFKAPEAKFVVATLGQTPKDLDPSNDGERNDKMIFDAHFAVDGEVGKYPEFKGNVSTVYTHPMSRGGSSNAHYSGNAEVYMDVGLAMGAAMVELLEKKE